MSTGNASRESGERYAELLHAARAALYDLIRVTEDDRADALWGAYDLVRALQRAEAERSERGESRQRARGARPSQRENWLAMPQHDRERLALEMLGDSRLSSGALAKRIVESREDLQVFKTDMATVLGGLRDSGVVERCSEPWRGVAGKRYVYYRGDATAET
jgi:hypothetical protein